MTKYHNLNEKIFNNYINKQCNKPTDLLMSPFHPFYFITYENYNYNDILIPGKKALSIKKKFTNYSRDISEFCVGYHINKIDDTKVTERTPFINILDADMDMTFTELDDDNKAIFFHMKIIFQKLISMKSIMILFFYKNLINYFIFVLILLMKMHIFWI